MLPEHLCLNICAWSNLNCRVFIAGEFIGGGDDTARKAGNGELQKLLSSKGLL